MIIMKKNILNGFFVFVFLITFLGLINANYIPEANMKIFAVTSNNTAMEATLHAEIKPGTGRIFSSIHTIVGSQTQESEKNAVIAATTAVGDDTRNKYDFYFDIQSSASSIDGPSAGGAIALLLVSMLTGNDLNEKVSITGSITSDGYVGDVGGVYAKAKKASEVGIKLFMVPFGNRQQVITKEDGSTDLVDLIDYSYKNWGMKIVEVQTIDDILEYASMDLETIDINKPIIQDEKQFIPEKIKISEAIKPMREIVDKYLIDANESILNSEKSINDSIIKDSSITQGLISLLAYSKEALENAEIYSKYNYMYTSANEAFLTKLYGMVILEVMDNPSILSVNSTIYNLKIKELEQKLKLTEERSRYCSLEKIEWCIGARQRITWAKDKIDDLKLANRSSLQNQNLDKILNLAYASGWIEIANDFLDIGIVSQGNNFKESSYFKEVAEKYIIDIENDLTISDESIVLNEDLQRRLTAAKTNLTNGWYVSSLFDAATAKAVMVSSKENTSDIFDESVFLKKYDVLTPLLRSTEGLSKTNNVWSKQFFDHSLYYYKKYLSYENKQDTRAISDLKTANSIINFAVLLYDVEKDVLSYYNNANADIITEIIDIESSVKQDQEESKDSNSDKSVYYVYTKEDDSKEKLNFTYLYIYILALFAMIISLVIYVERNSNKKIKVQKKLAELDEKLIEGKISAFTYKELRAEYIRELKHLKDFGSKKKYAESKVELKKDIVNKMTAVKDLTLRKKSKK